MKVTSTLVLLVTGLSITSVQAQTKAAVKSTKPATTTTKTATPTAKRTSATSATSTTPKSASTPSGTRVVAKPTAKPASTATPTSTAPPAPAPEAPAAPRRLDIPGVAAQQAPSFAKGDIAVNLGIGLGIGYGYSSFGFTGNSSSSPALSLSVEKGMVEGIGPGVISVGGLVGYKSYTYKYSVLNDSYKATWNNIYVAARGAYHYNFTANPKVDTYAGVSVGARIENYSNSYSGSPTNDSYGGMSIEGGIFLGGRYLLTNKIGAFAELGYDMSFLKLGITSKF